MATLTLVEVELLLPCLHDLKRLERGEVQASTALRKHFVRVCLGETAAVTAHEKAYLTWRATKPDLERLKTKLLAAEAQSLTHQNQVLAAAARDREQKRAAAEQRIAREARQRDAREAGLRVAKRDPKLPRFEKSWNDYEGPTGPPGYSGRPRRKT